MFACQVSCTRQKPQEANVAVPTCFEDVLKYYC